MTLWLRFTGHLFYALSAKSLGHAHNVSDKAVMAAFHVLSEEGARMLQAFVREQWQAQQKHYRYVNPVEREALRLARQQEREEPFRDDASQLGSHC